MKDGSSPSNGKPAATGEKTHTNDRVSRSRLVSFESKDAVSREGETLPRRNPLTFDSQLVTFYNPKVQTMLDHFNYLSGKFGINYRSFCILNVVL